MAGLSSWIDSHFNVIQTVGIIGTLWVAIGVWLRDTKAKEGDNLLTIAGQHKALWSKILEYPDLLGRVEEPSANVTEAPPSVAERAFLNMVIVHFEDGWKMAKTGGITKLKELANDAKGFFSLPLPRAVWDSTKGARNSEFVQFVTDAMASQG